MPSIRRRAATMDNVHKVDVPEEALAQSREGPASLGQFEPPPPSHDAATTQVTHHSTAIAQNAPSPREEEDDDDARDEDDAMGRTTPSGSAGNWKKHVWKAAEDEQLHHLVAAALQEGGKVRWSAIGTQMDGRSGKQCREVRKTRALAAYGPEPSPLD